MHCISSLNPRHLLNNLFPFILTHKNCIRRISQVCKSTPFFLHKCGMLGSRLTLGSPFFGGRTLGHRFLPTVAGEGDHEAKNV